MNDRSNRFQKEEGKGKEEGEVVSGRGRPQAVFPVLILHYILRIHITIPVINCIFNTIMNSTEILFFDAFG